jgi:hypothetical protein
MHRMMTPSICLTKGLLLELLQEWMHKTISYDLQQRQEQDYM